MPGQVFGSEPKTPANFVDARRRALVAFDLDRLVVPCQGPERIAPSQARCTDYRRFNFAHRVPWIAYAGSLEQS